MRLKILFGLILAVGVGILSLIYGPLLHQEIKQQARNQKPIPQAEAISPINTQFAVIIPKIGVNSPVIENVDSLNETEYMQALSKGVAQAKGSVLPGQNGTVFLFAHSSMNFWQARKYNSVFYLLYWLKPSDEVLVYFRNNHYLYRVEDTKIIDATNIEYLYQFQPKQKLVLMTCWPPGTNLKRLIVTAGLAN